MYIGALCPNSPSGLGFERVGCLELQQARTKNPPTKMSARHKLKELKAAVEGLVSCEAKASPVIELQAKIHENPWAGLQRSNEHTCAP